VEKLSYTALLTSSHNLTANFTHCTSYSDRHLAHMMDIHELI